MRKNYITSLLIVLFTCLLIPIQMMAQQVKDLNANKPEARIYHSLGYHDKKDNFLVFAGLTKRGWIGDLRDIWKYDPRMGVWEVVGICYDIKNDKVVLWGGRKKDLLTDNNIWVYDYIKDTWESKENKGGPEKPLTYSVMVNRVNTKDNIIFGGAILESVYKGTLMNDMVI